jgi:hypothetical protein
MFECGFLAVVNMKIVHLTVPNSYKEKNKVTEKQDGRKMNIKNA